MASTQDFYKDKLILAPMVRVGTLPMRLLALRYGADIVYCEEIIDFKILNASKVENELIGTVDFVLSDDTVVFRTCPQEKDKLVFQLGTSNAKRALKAAQKIQDYVSGVDVNMGCPKEFSIKGGMGAALLTQPEKVKEILTTLVKGLNVPVTCKIRILPKMEDMLNLVKTIESTGVSAIAVHGRYKEERPRHTNHDDVIKVIAQHIGIPVIANGGSGVIKQFSDIQAFRGSTGASSVMIARAAEWNPTIFRPEGKLPLMDVVREYIKVAIDYDNNYTNTKYCVLQMMHADMDIEEGLKTLSTDSLQDISEVWGLLDYYTETRSKFEKKRAEINTLNNLTEDVQISKGDSDLITINMPLKFVKRDFPTKISPKQRLFEWLRRTQQGKPVYDTAEREDRNFNCVLTVNNKVKFTTPYWEKSKQLAEQASATVATTVLDIGDGRAQVVTPQLENCRTKWRQLFTCQNCDGELAQNVVKILKCDTADVDSGSENGLKNETEISLNTKRKDDEIEDDRPQKICKQDTDT
ncbi:hypothetical protein FSP39_000398 [Pinctada imbricata]|uniref:DRBM domain-containing protein n=1 Tax=Pinctada imbricata TaxID=66713 RepID=A0AA88XPU8_PINIB|nr:hypothetical protein FSP39_000398 [Pinctada imbricata]